ncbi:TPA: protein kinase [Stenotrophomonas maltophilia]|nr:protein kinase [Stenotrophomonas maltophilia]
MDAAQAQEFVERLTDTTVGGWHLHSLLGKGKSAVVMKATKLQQVAAVKVFHRELIERFGRDTQLARIHRELTLIGVDHPNLVKILDGGECESTGNLFVVMELLSWDNVKEARGSIPAENIPILLKKLASAAEHLEGMGLVHRDIKPENIAVSPERLDLKLLDMGVIKPVGISGLTDISSRPFIGTLQYSSPEYLLREEVDTIESWRALTFYQIGAVLHDLIMQKEIFSDRIEPYARLVRAVIEELPIVVGGDPKLVSLCKYCLVKDPDVRLQLVNWASFNISNDRADELVKMSERLRLRRKYEAARTSTAADILGGESLRLRRQLIERACSQLDFQISLINKLHDVFPLCSSKPSVSYEEGLCSCVLTYEPEDGLGFPVPMRVEFRLKLVVENGNDPVFQLTGACLHLDEDAATQPEISIGLLSEVLSEDVIACSLMAMVERTYEQVDARMEER